MDATRPAGLPCCYAARLPQGLCPCSAAAPAGFVDGANNSEVLEFFENWDAHGCWSAFAGSPPPLPRGETGACGPAPDPGGGVPGGETSGTSSLNWEAMRPPEDEYTVRQKGRSVTVTRARLQELFHLPVSEASRVLGVGETVFKRLCRRLGVPSWPYRRVDSLRKIIQHVELVDGSSYELVGAVRELERQLGLLEERPDADLSSSMKTLRQFTFKQKHKEKIRAHKRRYKQEQCEQEH